MSKKFESSKVVVSRSFLQYIIQFAIYVIKSFKIQHSKFKIIVLLPDSCISFSIFYFLNPNEFQCHFDWSAAKWRNLNKIKGFSSLPLWLRYDCSFVAITQPSLNTSKFKIIVSRSLFNIQLSINRKLFAINSRTLQIIQNTGTINSIRNKIKS